jgi:nucleoside-diphosphate-sugar epimerase
MRILVIGGTRYFGIYMVNELLARGHEVTIATRGKTKHPFRDKVSRIILDRTNEENIKNTLSGKKYDVVIDKTAYCSNDIKYCLDTITCDKYIYMSSTSVYDPKQWNTKEEDFDALSKELIWCSRSDYPYEETKRQAECALWQVYKNKNAIAVRYPFVIGKDDYTKRLQFYVEHTMKEIPMYIDNIDEQMSYIRSDEAGKFMAFLADKIFTGSINGSSNGTISIREILNDIEQKTGRKAVINADGEAAPFNCEPMYSINTDKAKKIGFEFSNLKDWIFELIDYYIEVVGEKR